MFIDPKFTLKKKCPPICLWLSMQNKKKRNLITCFFKANKICFILNFTQYAILTHCSKLGCFIKLLRDQSNILTTDSNWLFSMLLLNLKPWGQINANKEIYAIFRLSNLKKWITSGDNAFNLTFSRCIYLKTIFLFFTNFDQIIQKKKMEKMSTTCQNFKMLFFK